MVRAPFRRQSDELPPGVRYVESLGVPVGRVFSYNRVSSDIQVRKGSGISRQIADSAAFCERHGLELDESLRLTDPGRSAFKGQHLEDGADLRRFLDLAQSGQLGANPMLIIEAVDRVSRMDMYDALDLIFMPMLRAGVTIYDLDDNQAYNQALVRRDGVMQVMRLALRIDEAHKKSARLKDRITKTWEIHRELLRSGVIKRPRAFCPSWCDYDEETQAFTFNEKVNSVRRCFELLRYYGTSVTARKLNEQGFAPLKKGTQWTKTGVIMLLRRDQVYGAIRLHEPGYWTEGRRKMTKLQSDERLDQEHWQERGEVIEDFLPAALSKQEVLAVRALVRERAKVGRQAIRLANSSMHWFGQRLTYCICGDSIENHNSWCSGERCHVRYLRCRKRYDCKAPGLRMADVSAHVLARLGHQELSALCSSSESLAEADDLKDRITEGENELVLARERQGNFSQQLIRLMEDGVDVIDLLPRKEQIKGEINRLEEDLAKARGRYHALCAPKDHELASEAIQELRLALLDGESTAEQRCRVHNVLRDFGIKIYTDGAARRVGLQVGQGAIDWQPLAPQAARMAVESGVVQASLTRVDELGTNLALALEPEAA